MPSNSVIIRNASSASKIVRLFSSELSPLLELHDIRAECLSAAATFFERRTVEQKRIIDELLPRFAKLKRENARLREIIKAGTFPKAIKFYEKPQ